MADTDHFVEMCYSVDGGANWSNWKRRSIGEVGQYAKRVRFMRLGKSRQRVFRIRVSSPRKHDLLGAVLTPELTDD
ncbi:hypothetical protein G5C63_19450 [Stenotrophomonas pavanii]|uniref:hypothetical protein n=1 Tax=Stenotrophomonas pavanii TaxID=487698 RepID=UPI0013E07975|nr:hypothetical protein [Stenotrophomonas pavanii]NGM56484.1 hypothetical protein [Stenotrophomonas pavanii]